MDYLEQIEETDAEGLCFQVKHKTLQVPRNLYLDKLDNYDEPFSEEAAQHLTQKYLDWKDDQGLLGMIRIEDNPEENLVRLDVAMRYVVECEE
ncbi:hypothetical protein MWH28_11415 [Natroniella sulfidigena]|uniref:hypothetical protein n=1 Tax=Natroniella sulfidigena TaxID=723921 RepID=UPI00200A218E|nr:hypothetical protein [Natroniella sulfidigena]MCK8817965.1 hypothetical protein [Natroniella sulfidigena]